MFYYWGTGYHSTTDTSRNATWGEESFVDAQTATIKAKFVDKGIPVIIGEYAAIRRNTLTGDNLTTHLKSRLYFLNYVTKRMVANGLVPFYWDAGTGYDNSAGLINRSNYTVVDQDALNAIVKGSKGL